MHATYGSGFGTHSYIEIRFGTSRFIQTVTLLGSSYSSCISHPKLMCSRNWFVTVGDGTGSLGAVMSNQEVWRYTVAGDVYGKEISVGMTAQSVTIWKNYDGYNLKFRSILLTTTSTDCTGNFDWTGTTLT